MPRDNDPAMVRAEYADESRLLARNSVYADAEGPDVLGWLIEALLADRPSRVLEVGCGPGQLAERLERDHGLPVIALDSSPRMVALTRARDVEAVLGDVQALPFPDGVFDAVIAAWMLYHVPDVDRGLREVERVLRPGGRLLAIVNGERHLAELWRLIGLGPYAMSVNAENAETILGRHFAAVERHDVHGHVTFADRASVRAYVAASIRAPELADAVPELTGPLRAARHSCVLIATKRA